MVINTYDGIDNSRDNSDINNRIDDNDGINLAMMQMREYLKDIIVIVTTKNAIERKAHLS